MSENNAYTGTLNIAGDFAHPGGTISALNSGIGVIIFNGATQNCSGAGTISGLINFTISSGATLTGTGTIGSTAGATTNSGTIAPGNSIGTLTINGNFTNNGTINAEVNGLVSPNSDMIIVSGTANLGGTLNIINIGTISVGNAFTLIQGSLNGSFTTVNLPDGIIPTNWSINTPPNYILTYILGPTLFPIELTSFAGRPVSNTIHLSWRTATEQNNDYMAVERSADGAKFEELGRVKGAGNTEEPQEYSFVDENPYRGMNYYRLRQVDFDGAFEYHKTIGVLFDRKSNGLGVQAFPNPAQASLQARWAPDASRPTILRLLDITGRKLAEYQAPAGSATFELPLNGLPAGLYFLHASQGSISETMRFRKQ